MLHAASSQFRIRSNSLRLQRPCFSLFLSLYASISAPYTVFASKHRSFVSDNALVDVFDHVLQLCKAVRQCRQVHAQIIASDSSGSGFLAARTVSSYSRLGRLLDAQNVFDTVPSECLFNLLLWNSILRANVSHGFYEIALELYAKMLKLGVYADGFTFPLVLRACRFTGCFSLCKIVHNHATQMGFQHHLHVVNELLGIYSWAGRMDHACNLFDEMTVRNYISWNSMISGFSQNYDCDGALKMFERMKLEGFEPNQVTWTSMLSCHSQCGQHEEVIKLFDVMRKRGARASAEALAVFFSVCADIGAFDRAKVVHGYVIKGGFEDYLFLKNALVCVYGKQGNVNEAQKLFKELRNKNIVSWNSLITSFAEAGLCDEALSFFSQLEVTDDSLVGRPDVISWSSVISGCATHGRWEESLELFRRMQLSKVLPNSVTYASVLSVCAELAALNLGREVHGHVIRASMGDNIHVKNGLVNMYTKCGSLKEGNLVFEKIDEKDLISWNSMITGYGMHGHGGKALSIFHQMIKAGFHPDEVTFIAVLSACSHAGFVAMGREIFHKMSKEFGIEPKMEHYACIVDLLGRAGFLNEASSILKSMPMKPNACVWGALLNSCRMHKNTDVAEETASQIFNLHCEMTGSYMLLSNIYAESGRWEDSARIRASAKTRDLKKVAGSSWIDVKKRVCIFSAGKTLSIGSEKVYQILEYLALHMESKGSISVESFFEENLDEEEKRLILQVQ